MRKRICRTVTLFLMTVLTTMSATQIMPVNAEEVQEHGALLVDNAGILEKEQYEELEKKLEEVSTQQACDVVIVTVPDLEGKEATVYADDYYDLQGYGQGQIWMVSCFCWIWETGTGPSVPVALGSLLLQTQDRSISSNRFPQN